MLPTGADHETEIALSPPFALKLPGSGGGSESVSIGWATKKSGVPLIDVSAIAHSFAASTAWGQFGDSPSASGIGCINSQIGTFGAVPMVPIDAISLAPAPAIWWHCMFRVSASAPQVSPVQIVSGTW